jgi:hypothetical protein
MTGQRIHRIRGAAINLPMYQVGNLFCYFQASRTVKGVKKPAYAEVNINITIHLNSLYPVASACGITYDSSYPADKKIIIRKCRAFSG